MKRNKAESIVFAISCNENERKSSTLRRLNFYTKNNYRFIDVEYVKKPRLTVLWMSKKL